MKSIVEALNVLFKHCNFLFLLVYVLWLTIGILRLFTSNVCLQYLFLTANVEHVYLFESNVVIESEGEELAVFC